MGWPRVGRGRGAEQSILKRFQSQIAGIGARTASRKAEVQGKTDRNESFEETQMRNTGCGLMMAVAAALAFAPPGFAAAPAADAPPRYNVVELQADAQREVQNDLLNATLYVELSDPNAAALASAMNKRANEALRVAKEYPAVRARSGGNHTYPVYSRGNALQGWRGRAEIRIESRDFESAAALIGKLQSGMQLSGVSFSASPEARRAAENELITEALAAFKARAEIVRAALGGKGYRIQRVSLATSHPPARPLFAQQRAMASSSEVTAPEFEGGVSQMTVMARGTIEVE
jgi:predicted secreted protein